jgi:membrane protein DedA with SNARE-associated domain
VGTLEGLIAAHGYWILGALIGLESMGIPLPGETALISAAIYAGTTHRLNIVFVIVAAIVGAVAGDNAGFWIGRRFGHGLLVRYGHLVKLNARRIRLGQFLFDRHGGTVVFFGRFVAVLRAAAALLAGINRMRWRPFLLFNAAGGIVWATGYGLAAYALGERIERFEGPVRIGAFALAAGAVLVGLWMVRRHEARLEQQVHDAR